MSADPVLLAQLDAIDAQLALLKVQIDGLRHRLATPAPPTARLSLPERCTGLPAQRCALQDEDARRSRGSFVDPNAWQCVGCGHREAGPGLAGRSTGE